MRITRELACLAYMAFDCRLYYAAIESQISMRAMGRHIHESPCLPPTSLESGSGVSGQPQEAIDFVVNYARRDGATEMEKHWGSLVIHHQWRFRDMGERQNKRPDFNPDLLVTSKEHAEQLAAASDGSRPWWDYLND